MTYCFGTFCVGYCVATPHRPEWAIISEGRPSWVPNLCTARFYFACWARPAVFVPCPPPPLTHALLFPRGHPLCFIAVLALLSLLPFCFCFRGTVAKIGFVDQQGSREEVGGPVISIKFDTPSGGPFSGRHPGRPPSPQSKHMRVRGAVWSALWRWTWGNTSVIGSAVHRPALR